MHVVQKRCDLLFPVPVGVIQYEGHEELNKKILEEINAVDWNEYHAEKGVRYDVDDTKAEDTFIDPDLVPSCKPVLQAFFQNCNEYSAHLTWAIDPAGTKLTGFWAHVTQPGERTIPRAHTSRSPLNHWSGAYYVKTPENCGNINFWVDRLVRAYEPTIKDPRKVYSLSMNYHAKEGLMLIFPSWLYHKVGVNKSNETRVSLSFNASLATAEQTACPREMAAVRDTESAQIARSGRKLRKFGAHQPMVNWNG